MLKYMLMDQRYSQIISYIYSIITLKGALCIQSTFPSDILEYSTDVLHSNNTDRLMMDEMDAAELDVIFFYSTFFFFLVKTCCLYHP